MAFAVLFSLSQTINQILNDGQYPVSVDGRQKLASIHKQVISLQDFLEKFPKEANNVHRRIREAANEAEDIIEHFMYEQIRWHYKLNRANAAGIATVNSKTLYNLDELNWAMEEIDSVAREVMDIVRLGHSPTALSSSSRVFSLTGDNIVVGFEDDVMEIKDLLCGHSSKLHAVPIVGMGGIGKTTLAKKIYDDRLIVEHFDIRGWVTVSQDYDTQNILLNLLDSMDGIKGEWTRRSTELFDIKVYQFLKGRRYLIVLDDVWSSKVWDDVKRIFPDDSNGSRVVLTTRLYDVASYIDSSSHLHQMRFLNQYESWTLLEQKVFKHQNFLLKLEKRKENTASELSEIGKEIAGSCGGLPLAIVLIAGALSTVRMTPASWKEIAENVRSAYHKEAGQIEAIMSLSYTHLPHHLRPCFLYMGGFPEDYEIRVSKLVKLWIAEGFVNSSVSKSIEDEAEEYLMNLVSRSLVIVTSRKTDGKIKTCSLHDVVRELSRRKAQDENFKRRLSIAHPDLKSLAKTYASTIRSVICFKPSESSLGALRKFRLLRVLDVIDANVYSLPAQVFELFHLRYLAFGCPMKIPAAISMLQNLHTLIICPRKGSRRCSMDEVYLPVEIWNLPLLRHLVSFFDLLPDPEVTAFALENLQTLSVVKKSLPNRSFLERIPNLKRLEITFFEDKYPEEHYQLHNLVYLYQLETLKLIWNDDHLAVRIKYLDFPLSLKKLTLSGWQFPWEYMESVGNLPNLQVLKLRDSACKGNEWVTTEGKFSRLEYLLIDKSDLRNWITEYSHFPRLKHLVLYRCPFLGEIPSDIGEIPTLQLIAVDQANKNLVESTKRIQEEEDS